MKKLGIAIGNSNIICGYYEKDKLITERFLHEDYEQISKFKGAKPLIASVVPHIENKVISLFESYSYASSSLKSNYKTAGIDRLLVCEAALSIYKLPLIVIDAGTAITINIVNSVDGEVVFLGGSIMPGLLMALNSLQNAALLPKLVLKKEAPLIGTTTEEAMFSGVLIGTASALDGMIDKLKAEINPQSIIITGGGADILLKYMNQSMFHEKELLMKGLLQKI